MIRPDRGIGRPFGFVEWFRPGEYARTEQILLELEASGATYLRSHLSWAEFYAPGGPEWFDWLIPRLAARHDFLPCIHYTPPSLSRTGRASGAPQRLRDYADFVDLVLTRYGKHFSHVELWNEPNNLLDWDWREDQDYALFCEMIGDAAYWARERGWQVVLGGPSPFDPYWLNLMGERGILDLMSAVGFHGFPGTWDSEEGSWSGWDVHLGEMREILDRYNPQTQIWITETGYSTWRKDEIEQARRFVKALNVPAHRMYWYSWQDVPHDVPVQEGFWFDARHYHLGAVDHGGQPKLLARLLMDGGATKVAELTALAAPSLIGRVRTAVVTGGSGFIGCNIADALLRQGREVVILDNLSRPGVDQNLSWLKENHGTSVHPALTDIRDLPAIMPAFAEADVVFHLAAQTAVTTSMTNPLDDFDVNGRGTLNVLEAIRATGKPIPLLFASTNKVYGALADIEMIELEDRYIPEHREVRRYGIGEDRPLDFCTPYGCSKGVADQYVCDYASSFGIPTAALRMSCIYGQRQFGTEDQGWVAHFLIQALKGAPITIFGDGKQVRDILHVDDAVRAYLSLADRIHAFSGRPFNLGGGPANTVSLKMVLQEIQRLVGRELDINWSEWRPGDQNYFVADTRGLFAAVGWQPSRRWQEGIADLHDWLAESRRGSAGRQAAGGVF